jgi:hypothetical protein
LTSDPWPVEKGGYPGGKKGGCERFCVDFERQRDDRKEH